MMCALLARTISTWVEPKEMDHIPTGALIELSHKFIVPLANSLQGKKVYLYRELHEQLGAHLQLGAYKLDFHADVWASYCKAAMKMTDVLWIESNSFFRDVRGTIDKVCNHYGLPNVASIAWSEHNCKLYVIQGGTYSPIILPEPPDWKGEYTAIEGVIEKEKALGIESIAQAVDKAKDKYPELLHLI